MDRLARARGRDRHGRRRLLHDLALRVASTEVAYAGVFAVEAVGLVACIPLLRRINVDTFAKEVAEQSARRSAAALGWQLPSRPADVD